MTSRSCRFSVVAAAVGLVALLPSACGKASTPRPGGEAKTAAAKTPAQTKAVDTKTADTKTADTQTADTKTADSPPAPTGRLKVSPGPDFAVVVHSKGIEVLDPKGGSAGMLVNEPVAWCKVDDRARLLWFVAADAGGLFALDLEGTGPAVPVLTQTPETIVIDYPGEPSGVPDGSQFEEGVVVHMETPPRREAAFGCDGDMVWSCFDEPGDDEDFDAVRNARMAKYRAKVDALPFPGKQSLAPFVARAEGRTTEPPEPGRAPKPTKVTSVPTEACEENPEDCGTASPLRGTAYWIVTVSNSRGDFYHEASQLYDPKDGMFFDPRRPGTRSKEPLAETDGSEAYRPTWISPSGALSMSYDELVRFEGGIVARDLAGTCGFWGGGWTVDLGG